MRLPARRSAADPARLHAILREVRRTGSLLATGRSFGMSSPTLRAEIERAEQRLGCRLVVASPRGTRLTDQAAALIDG